MKQQIRQFSKSYTDYFEPVSPPNPSTAAARLHRAIKRYKILWLDCFVFRAKDLCGDGALYSLVFTKQEDEATNKNIQQELHRLLRANFPTKYLHRRRTIASCE